MTETKNEVNNKSILRSHYREVLLDILTNGPGYFTGKYDAENANIHYMNGIDIVIDYLIVKAFDNDRESIDHIYEIIDKNKKESLERANLKKKHYTIISNKNSIHDDVYQAKVEYNRAIREKLYSLNKIIIIDDRDDLDDAINHENFDLFIKKLSKENNSSKKKAKFLVVKNKNHLSEDKIALILDTKFMLDRGFEYERSDKGLIITIPIC